MPITAIGASATTTVTRARLPGALLKEST